MKIEHDRALYKQRNRMGQTFGHQLATARYRIKFACAA